jgi:hypothetical protein
MHGDRHWTPILQSIQTSCPQVKPFYPQFPR